MFPICPKRFKINFQNRKQNYPNRKWNYFSHFRACNQITSFTKCSSFVPRGSKLIFKTGNGIIQTRNGIISSTSKPLMKKFFYKMFFISSKGLKLIFKTGNGIIQTGYGIISPTFRPLNLPNRKWNYPNRKQNCFLDFQKLFD